MTDNEHQQWAEKVANEKMLLPGILACALYLSEILSYLKGEEKSRKELIAEVTNRFTEAAGLIKVEVK